MVAPESSARLRAIIVGAGIGGLTTAHALHRAGIDYVVVEKHDDVLKPFGSTITLHPGQLRILHQLGLLDRLKTLARPYNRGGEFRDSDGRLLSKFDLSSMRIKHGEAGMLMNRESLIKILYEALPDKSKVLTGRLIVAIAHEADSVQVQLSDGLSETGHLIIGADGVHSVVRSAMWEHADATNPGLIPPEDKKVVGCKWKLIWASGPEDPRLSNDVTVGSFPGRRCSIVLSQPGIATFIMIWKTSEAGPRSSQRRKYTAEDAEELMASIARLPVNESVTFGDLWKNRFRQGMSDTQVGVMKRWHHGRIVLVGDATFSITPTTGLGANMCIENVAALVNALHEAVVEATRQGRGRPTGSDLEAAFHKYRDRQWPRTLYSYRFANFFDRLYSWDTPWMRFWACCVARTLSMVLLPKLLSDHARGVPVLKFVDLVGWPEGRIRWEHGEEEKGGGGGGRGGALAWMLLAVVVLLGAVGLAFVMGGGGI
ncbi:hypothetical protein XA68_11101 [Ophiocordyceps unilateralis]|uniref:FAD-binding domain-containing protein n=1 Tax=Ophiocordyceps unilateralis TaxID=268505 RepID=A0A2A9PG42_OPHUN|nr:hypothetical protein XA68_11101 [Ophiocordyceps unilateralis]